MLANIGAGAGEKLTAMELLVKEAAQKDIPRAAEVVTLANVPEAELVMKYVDVGSSEPEFPSHLRLSPDETIDKFPSYPVGPDANLISYVQSLPDAPVTPVNSKLGKVPHAGEAYHFRDIIAG